MNEIELEQPNLEPDNNQNNDLTYSENQDGSMIGKFKDAKTLLDAYNSLQAEFTRKSQKLAEFQKEYEENANFKTYNNLDEFISNTSDSDKYKDKIMEILVKDNELNNLPNKYQVAYKVVKQSESNLAESLNSQDFLDKYILNNESIKTQIINNYLSTLNNISPAPKVISGNSTNIHFSPNVNKPKTLKEAGEIFSKMLN